MSVEHSPYSRNYIKAWTALSILLGVVLLSMFVFGQHFLKAGQIVWDLLRYLASPLI